jgi:hypothetical protein
MRPRRNLGGGIQFINKHLTKAAIEKEVVLAYPNFLKPFEVYIDTSSTQLGAMIAQDNRSIAFFSRKLSKMQQKYSVREIELLAVCVVVDFLASNKRGLFG